MYSQSILPQQTTLLLFFVTAKKLMNYSRFFNKTVQQSLKKKSNAYMAYSNLR